jgi:hypothetical protein
MRLEASGTQTRPWRHLISAPRPISSRTSLSAGGFLDLQDMKRRKRRKGRNGTGEPPKLMLKNAHTLSFTARTVPTNMLLCGELEPFFNVLSGSGGLLAANSG